MSLVRISEIRVYMLLYLGLFMDTGLAVISIIRLHDLNIRVVTWYMGSGLKAQNMTGIRAQGSEEWDQGSQGF